MPHVRIQGFRPGHAQKHRPEYNEAAPPIDDKEMNGMPWIEGQQHPGSSGNSMDPQNGDRHKPQQHYWPEKESDATRAHSLHHEQSNEDKDRNQYDVMLERACRYFQ